MSTIYNFLFPTRLNGQPISLFLLAMRILFGGLLFWHGYNKMIHFSAISSSFPDPLDVGSEVSLILAIFGEMICSLLFIFGILYRLVLLPMIFTMSVAFFVIHSGADFAVKELSFIYLMVFVILYITGPGKYSIDGIIAKRLKK